MGLPGLYSGAHALTFSQAHLTFPQARYTATIRHCRHQYNIVWEDVSRQGLVERIYLQEDNMYAVCTYLLPVYPAAGNVQIRGYINRHTAHM